MTHHVTLKIRSRSYPSTNIFKNLGTKSLWIRHKDSSRTKLMSAKERNSFNSFCIYKILRVCLWKNISDWNWSETVKNNLTKPIKEAPLQIQRFLLTLKKYNFHFSYIPRKLIVLADTLGRATLNNKTQAIVVSHSCLNPLHC